MEENGKTSKVLESLSVLAFMQSLVRLKMVAMPLWKRVAKGDAVKLIFGGEAVRLLLVSGEKK